MGDQSGIEWTDATWNPVLGCDKVSPGCDHCYAIPMSRRVAATGNQDYAGLIGYDAAGRVDWSGTIKELPGRLDQPARWTKPRRVFVNSMSDLFHAKVSNDFIAAVFAVMAATPRHTYQILTKRHGRMRSLLNSPEFRDKVSSTLSAWSVYPETPDALRKAAGESNWYGDVWPLPNVWLGVSVEDQQRAELRIPALADTPAVIRFLSCEPLLGPLDLTPWLPRHRDPLAGGVMGYLSQGGRCDFQPTDTPAAKSHVAALCRQCTNGRRISWVIVGGESGPSSRPLRAKWVRDLRDQVTEAGVAFHFKQWGSYGPANATDQPDLMIRLSKKAAGRTLDGRTWDEFPAYDPSDGSVTTTTREDQA